MKKYIPLFLVFLLTACSYSRGEQSQITPSSVKEGYKELTQQVYLSDQIDPSYTEDLPTYETTKGDESTLIKVMQAHMGDDTKIEESVADRHRYTQLTKGDAKADVIVNKTGSWISLNTPQTSDLGGLFTSLLDDSLHKEFEVTEFRDSLPFSKEESVEKVRAFLARLDLHFDDYDYLTYAVSQDSLLRYLPIYEKKAEDVKGSKIKKENLTDMYYISVYPKLSGKRVVDSSAQLSSSRGINFVHGPGLDFIVTEKGLDFIDISGLVSPTSKNNDQITVSMEKGLEVLKQKYQDIILENPIYIEQASVEYAPMPLQDKEIYGGNRYRPLLRFDVKEKERTYSVFVDALTWKEVGEG